MDTQDAPVQQFGPTPVLRPREQVESQIREAILNGAIAPGDRLPSENELARSFGVSRATVREALRSLAERGLLAKGPSTTSGLYVESSDHLALSRVVSERLGNILGLGTVSYAEVAAFRDLLEVPSARLAATNRTDAHLAALRAIINEERTLTFDNPRVPELNAQFHSQLGDASGNRVLAAFVAALHRTAHPLAFIHTDEELGRKAVKHHIEIVSAVERHDIDSAVASMRTHLHYLHEHAKANGSSAERVRGRMWDPLSA